MCEVSPSRTGLINEVMKTVYVLESELFVIVQRKMFDERKMKEELDSGKADRGIFLRKIARIYTPRVFSDC